MKRLRGRAVWLVWVKGICEEAVVTGRAETEGGQEGKKVFPTFAENTIIHTRTWQ